MARKRSMSHDDDDSSSAEETSERMRDEDENEDMDSVDDDDEEDMMLKGAQGETLPFLDTFYGLSALDAVERSQSAHALLTHCFFSSEEVNTKDSAYALKRLFNGLCSGRAAARQGYASALTAFLKISFTNGSISGIQKDFLSGKEQEKAVSSLQFVRNQLLATTDPSQATASGKFGKRKKGSEERDYCFGRIFGIMSIQRSGILVSCLEEDDSDSQEVLSGLMGDLIELYRYKKWMREPASQGIVTLLHSFQNKDDDKKTRAVINHILTQVIVPQLLLSADDENKDKVEEQNVDKRSSILSQYSPEQLAVAIFIQSGNIGNMVDLPFPLDQEVLSPENIPLLSEALSSTSHVVHPRTHLVWEIIWSSLTSAVEKQERKQQPEERILSQDQSANDIVTELVQRVIIQSLLGGVSEKGKQSTTTHERRALALSLIKNLLGGTYTSCTTGPATIALDSDLLEEVVLSPVVVRRLFLDVICAGKGKQKQGSQQHMLKPLAVHVLESITENIGTEESNLDRRLVLAKTLLSCEPRFDGRTKTKTVSSLLLLDGVESATMSPQIRSMWIKYVDFLENHIVSLQTNVDMDGADEEESESLARSKSYEALGYVDLLFNTTKQILRMSEESDEDEQSLDEFKSMVTGRTLGFFLSSAFFDCSKLTAKKDTGASGKKKKKGKKTKNEAVHPAVSAGLRIKGILGTVDDSTTIPYAVRIILSSRYFSLLADCTALASPSKAPSSEDKQIGKGTKDAKILGILSDQYNGWFRLEESGAVRFTSSTNSEEDESQEKDADECKKLVLEFQSMAQDSGNLGEQGDGNLKTKARQKCASGAALLVSTLYLHLLHCGKPEHLMDEGDDADADDDDNEAEIYEIISDLSDVTKSLLEQNEDDEEEETNPLLVLADLCVSVLSSPFGCGSQTRGASSKIVRDAVKTAWVGGLSAAAYHSSSGESDTLLDTDVISVLLGAIGVEEEEGGEEEDQEMGQSDDDMSEADKSENDGADAIFNAAAAEALENDDDDVSMEGGSSEDPPKKGDNVEEEDVELDSGALQSLLLEDSDAELSDGEDKLEHHEGADAALAQLIKMKQEARKAGRQARERLELTNQLRCVVLLETVASHGTSIGAPNNLLRNDVILTTLLPLLKIRKKLQKSLDASPELGKKSSACVNEKRALLDRLTSVLKTKICKMRLASTPWSDSVNVATHASELVSSILDEARRSDDSSHGACCSAALIMTLRSVSKADEKVAAASAYGDAVKEWGSKRTTRLNPTLFEDLIHQAQSLAQATLALPLVSAAVDARSPFLKSEAFRLLASLYSTSNKSVTAEPLDGIEKLGLQSLTSAVHEIAEGLSNALKDSDMQKTKRIRDVLKAAEKIVSFTSHNSVSDGKIWKVLQGLPLDSLAEGTASHGVKKVCEKISTEIKAGCEAATVKDDMDTNEEGSMPSTKEPSSQKKKKKKGKK